MHIAVHLSKLVLAQQLLQSGSCCLQGIALTVLTRSGYINLFGVEGGLESKLSDVTDECGMQAYHGGASGAGGDC